MGECCWMLIVRASSSACSEVLQNDCPWLLKALYLFHHICFLCSSLLFFSIHLNFSHPNCHLPSLFQSRLSVLMNQTAKVRTGRIQTCMCEGGRQDVEDHHRNYARYKAMILYSCNSCANCSFFTCGWRSLLWDAIREGVCWEVW